VSDTEPLVTNQSRMWLSRCSGAVSPVSLFATAWCRTWLRKCDECSTRGDLDEAVLGEGFDGFAVEFAQRLL
jgi:hypothetical protein